MIIAFQYVYLSKETLKDVYVGDEQPLTFVYQSNLSSNYVEMLLCADLAGYPKGSRVGRGEEAGHVLGRGEYDIDGPPIQFFDVAEEYRQ